MEENKGQRIYKMVMAVVLTAVITAIITTLVIYNLGGKIGEVNYTTTSQGDTSTIAATLNNFRKMIEKYYLGEVDNEKLLEGAIKGYIEGLGDEYSEYFTKQELAEYKEDTLGNFVGIGIYMVKDTQKSNSCFSTN